MELKVTATARDGAGVARGDDGRVVFVQGALPDEVVEAVVVRTEKRWSRARIQRILEPSPHRVEVPCPHRRDGCGGCNLLHVDPVHQPRLRAGLVLDQLHRARVEAPEPTLVPLVDDRGRTTVRAAVVGGRAGYRATGSHEVVVPDGCDAVDPLLEEILVDGRFGNATGATLRVGSRTGERLVVVDDDPEDVAVPDDVLVVCDAELDDGQRAWIHEEAAGRRWRISARSFFQNRPAGVDALVEVVGAMVTDLSPGDGTGLMVDAYAGIGIFAGTVGVERLVVAVERGADSVADARVNLGHRATRGDVRFVRSAVDGGGAARADVVVADPARAGLGRAGVDVLLRCRPGLLVLVGCDHSAFARDAALLAAGGFHLERLAVVDLFPGTTHVEAVGAFLRS